jgi:ribonuclease HII
MCLLSYYSESNQFEAGCDEAGRGCLAGPVYAAAVIFPKGYTNELLDDSKKLSQKKRLAYREIIEKDALAWSVGVVLPSMIDQINILNASILAMHKAIEQLHQKPDFLLIDGNRFKPYKDIPSQTIIKGDGKYISIAAASILAKTYRDEYMLKLSREHPEYHWDTNKGYGTKAHREAIIQYGYTEFHRKSFHLKELASFDF